MNFEKVQQNVLAVHRIYLHLQSAFAPPEFRYDVSLTESLSDTASIFQFRARGLPLFSPFFGSGSQQGFGLLS